LSRDFVRPRTTNLAVTAAQIFEFADEGFCRKYSVNASEEKSGDKFFG
jgi:hypothetical protein